MKTLVWILLSWHLCLGASASGQQATNAVATNLLLRRPLELSPAAVRLNQSPYFKSEVDDFKKCVRHSLHANFTEEHLDLIVDFGATMERFQAGDVNHYLWVFAYADDPLDWVNISTNRLTVIVDGVNIISTEPVPGASSLKGERNKAGRLVSVSEGSHYQASGEVFRLIASARRAQFRLEGERGVIQRSLSATNIARFKVFVETFMDGKPASKSGLSEGTKDGVPISVWNEFAEAAKKDWPKDPHMQDWALRHSIEAWKKLNR